VQIGDSSTPNTAPVADDQSVTTSKNTAVPITLIATDADGDPLTFTYSQPPNGSVSGTAPNMTYTPDNRYVGPDSFTFFVQDDKLLTSNLATVSIDVTRGGTKGGGGDTTPTNEPPVASFTVANNICDPFGFNWVCHFTNTSTDADGSIPTPSFEWDYGDNTSETAVWSPSAEYSVEGFYTVTLTVTDSEGASDSTSTQVQIGNPTLPPLTIDSASGYKVKGLQKVDLVWSGGGTDVDIFRDGSLLATVANSGAYTDNIDEKGGGSYTYTVCEFPQPPEGPVCSADAIVNF
jgi:PKD repeat protein